MSKKNDFDSYIDDVITIAKSIKNDMSIRTLKIDDLSEKLLKYRISASIKLQKMNPLYLILEKIANDLNLQCKYQGIKSFLYDVSSDDNSVGRYQMYKISNKKKSILVNAIAVHDHNGDHKSKEWGARRRATLYRFLSNQVQKSGLDEGLFILDGDWKQKDINRLYYSGWNHIVRLPDLEDKLKEIFN